MEGKAVKGGAKGMRTPTAIFNRLRRGVVRGVQCQPDLGDWLWKRRGLFRATQNSRSALGDFVYQIPIVKIASETLFQNQSPTSGKHPRATPLRNILNNVIHGPHTASCLAEQHDGQICGGEAGLGA